MILNLVCKTFISVNHYMNYRVMGRRVIPFKPKTTKDFEKEFGKYVEEEIKKQGWLKPDKDKLIILDTVFYFKRKDMDAQNYFKSMCDVLTDAGVWHDDNVVMERVNRIFYDSENPRIELSIYPSDCEGIFDNKKELDYFIDKCKLCKRYSRNCSILKKSLEGRITDNVIKHKCNKFTI